MGRATRWEGVEELAAAGSPIGAGGREVHSLSHKSLSHKRDLTASFAWKQVALGFFSLTLRLAEARLRVVHMASSRRLRRKEAEDGRVDAIDCVGLFYPKIIISSIIGPRGIVVFYLGL
jgi:hypothetical protein